MNDKQTNRPYLDFYAKHNVSPVLNEMASADHFAQRAALYRHLNVLRNSVSGKAVLEFGPGNGINSLYTMSLNPRKYDLVDANQTGIENCRKNLSSAFPDKAFSLIESDIQDFASDEKYDFVCCEGLLPNQHNPQAMVQHCGSFVGEDGILVITCHDAVSLLSENLRALLGHILIRKCDDFETNVSVLSEFFEPQLNQLGASTRKIDDWVIDNILNTEFWQTAPLFSVGEAIEAMQEDFSVLGSSPSMFQDWSWYKKLGDDNNHFNNVAKKSYEGALHNLADVRHVSPMRSSLDNERFLMQAKQIREAVKVTAEIKADMNFGEALTLINSYLIALCEELPNDMTFTKQSIVDFTNGLRAFQNSGSLEFDQFGSFNDWWGRGMQYLSFTRK